MPSAKTPAEHAAFLRARAADLLNIQVPRAHARAATVAELATALLRDAPLALAAQLRGGELAKSFEAAVARAAETDATVGNEASKVPPAVRAVFVLLRAQIDRTAKWLAADGTEHGMLAMRLDGEATGLLGAADLIDPAPSQGGPAAAPGSPEAAPAAPGPGEGWVELPGKLYGRRGDAPGGTTPPFVLVTAYPGGALLALNGDDLVALGGMLSANAPAPPPTAPAPAETPARPA